MPSHPAGGDLSFCFQAKHTQEGSQTWGVNGETGDLVDMKELGIWEPLAVKLQTYKTAVEVRRGENFRASVGIIWEKRTSFPVCWGVWVGITHPVQGMQVSELVFAGGGIMRDAGAQAFTGFLILWLNFITFHPNFSYKQCGVLSLLAMPDRAVPEQSHASNMLESSVVVGALSLWLAGAVPCLSCLFPYKSCHYFAGVGLKAVP